MSEKMMVYSKKAGAKVAVSAKKVHASNLGWCLSGWSKSGGWKVPASK